MLNPRTQEKQEKCLSSNLKPQFLNHYPRCFASPLCPAFPSLSRASPLWPRGRRWLGATAMAAYREHTSRRWPAAFGEGGVVDASEHEGGVLRAHQEWSSGEHAGGGLLQRLPCFCLGKTMQWGVLAKEIPPQGHMRKGLNVKVIVTVRSSMKHQDFTRAYMHRAAHVIRIRYSLIFDS